MPKAKVEIVPVDKDTFMRVLTLKKSSIRKLGSRETKEVRCSEKTIRRELNQKDNPGLRPQYVDQIAKHLDVDRRLLTGELLKKQYWDLTVYNPLNHIEDFPYFRTEQKELKKENIRESLKRILSLFGVSFSQFEAKDFEAQYSFQHDLYTALIPVICNHFNCDGYGNDISLSAQRILADLEYYAETYYEEQFAETKLRPTFLSSPPKGYSVAQIKKMSPSELMDLHASLSFDGDADDLK